MASLLARNTKVWSLSLRANGMPGGHENSWLPELLRSAEQYKLEEVNFEMCLDYERSLGGDLWDYIILILRSRWLETMRSVAFIHYPVVDEPVYHNSFLQDGIPAFKRYLTARLKRQDLRIFERNAPVLNLGQSDPSEFQ